MSYVTKSLVTGEHIIYAAHFHWTVKLAALCAIPLAGFGIIWIIRLWSTDIVVTNRRLIYKRGWIARKTEEMSLRRLEEVNLRQGILGRLFGYGRVLCQGTGGSDIMLPILGSPMHFKKALQEAQARSN